MFLNGKYGERFSVDPGRFETTVAAVFAGIGYDARVTGQTGDGGIDVILDGPNDKTIGVQVKRYKEKIQANQIRELTGALVIKGHTKGIFVTTSDFTSGAAVTSGLSAARGVPIELVNAERFYDAMKIAATSTELYDRPPSRLVRVQVIGAFRKGAEEGNLAPHLGIALGRGKALFVDHLPARFPEFEVEFEGAAGVPLTEYRACCGHIDVHALQSHGRSAFHVEYCRGGDSAQERISRILCAGRAAARGTGNVALGRFR